MFQAQKLLLSGDRAGKRLAECIQESLLKFLGRKNRELKEQIFMF